MDMTRTPPDGQAHTPAGWQGPQLRQIAFYLESGGVVPFSWAYTHTRQRELGIGDRSERNCPVCVHSFHAGPKVKHWLLHKDGGHFREDSALVQDAFRPDPSAAYPTFTS